MRDKAGLTLGETGLTLMVLECYLRHGPCLSIKDLCVKTGVPRQKIEYISLVLEKRGYLIKPKDTDKYMLSKKIAMLI